MASCYLPKLEITLADGKNYSCRQLPFNRALSTLVEASQNTDLPMIDRVETFQDIIRKSMSFDQDQETIQSLFESGLIMISADPKPEDPMIIITTFAISGKRPAPVSANTTESDSFVAEAGG